MSLLSFVFFCCFCKLCLLDLIVAVLHKYITLPPILIIYFAKIISTNCTFIKERRQHYLAAASIFMSMLQPYCIIYFVFSIGCCSMLYAACS